MNEEKKEQKKDSERKEKNTREGRKYLLWALYFI